MKQLVIFVFCIALFASSCKKDAPVPAAPIPQQDLTQYSFFKVGTYWIYKDSASGVEDSVYVYYDTSYVYHRYGSAQAEGDYMFYACSAHSFYDTYNYYYRIDMGFYAPENHQVGVERIRTKTGDYVGTTYLMSSDFREGGHIGSYLSDGTVYFKSYCDSISLPGHWFHNVAKFYDSKNPTEYNQRTNFYIARNIGIVRKEKLDTVQVWNLLRYHIQN